ncbi:NrfD/PsrC family molybdoenzyme membrane anchor subunit [Corynebacterium bouchesdurhonense]|uniref:NrfD/PsrC family molybdoenzyme membrane anchor subunit n=1 Tax=Corynebacterium bouchesdurhonense TaxID=1720192 RepID=UPI00082C68DF|nr:NrfD/PsrC family molybdoenzyme membrane anchor subunit [Corynebacterium bouchesdurhonense]
MAEFDSFRPPEEPRGPRRRGTGTNNTRSNTRGKKQRRGEELMVPKAQFEQYDSYYGKPIVKFPPWEWPIAGYLFLGGVAGGSALLSLGAGVTGNRELERNTRLAAFGAAGVGSGLLILDLGRPERLLNMFRVFKISSPMSVGSWILGAFGSTSAIAAAAEVDELTGERLPLPGAARGLLQWAATPAGVASGILGAPLAVYTAVLLGNTSVPMWQDAHQELPALFVSSAASAASGAALVTTSTGNAGPARALAVIGAAADVAASRRMEANLTAPLGETVRAGKAGRLLKAAEACVVAGGAGALLAGRNRAAAALSGAALMAGSCLTRFGIIQAGRQSTEDPKYVVEPQRERLERRRREGRTGDAITTAR